MILLMNDECLTTPNLVDLLIVMSSIKTRLFFRIVRCLVTIISSEQIPFVKIVRSEL